MSYKTFGIVLACLLSLLSTTHAMGLDFVSDDKADEDMGEERFFIPIALGNNGINLTQLAALAALAAATLLPILGLAALGIMLWALLSQQQAKDSGGYSSTGHGGGHSSYSSSYKRSYQSAEVEWESLSIMDWLAVAEDAYNNFDPSDIECQKRVVCEMHQNADRFGPVAQTIVHYFSYLQYASVLSVPDDIKTLSEELLDAADRGRTLKKDCSELFGGCDFSVKKVMEKYGHINSIATNTI